MSGSTDAERLTQKIETTPASTPLMMNATEMTRFAGTPMSRVVVNLSAAARIAMPSTVYFMSSVRPASSTAVVTMTRMLRSGTVAPEHVDRLVEGQSGSGTARARGETKSSAAFCRKHAHRERRDEQRVHRLACAPGETRRARSGSS